MEEKSTYTPNLKKRKKKKRGILNLLMKNIMKIRVWKLSKYMVPKQKEVRFDLGLETSGL